VFIPRSGSQDYVRALRPPRAAAPSPLAARRVARSERELRSAAVLPGARINPLANKDRPRPRNPAPRCKWPGGVRGAVTGPRRSGTRAGGVPLSAFIAQSDADSQPLQVARWDGGPSQPGHAQQVAPALIIAMQLRRVLAFLPDRNRPLVRRYLSLELDPAAREAVRPLRLVAQACLERALRLVLGEVHVIASGPFSFRTDYAPTGRRIGRCSLW